MLVKADCQQELEAGHPAVVYTFEHIRKFCAGFPTHFERRFKPLGSSKNDNKSNSMNNNNNNNNNNNHPPPTTRFDVTTLPTITMEFVRNRARTFSELFELILKLS